MTAKSRIQMNQSFTLKMAYLFFLGMIFLFQPDLLKAAENKIFKISPSLEIQEVKVSGKDPSQWPEGNWYPFSAKKYNSLISRALLKKNTPKSSWIQEATYEATLDDDHLINGRLTYALHSSKREPRFVELSNLNLAIHEFKWGNQDAVWGLAPNQKKLLLVDHFNEPLAGQWSLKGRKLPRRTEFFFQLPETVVSRIHLKIPQGMILTTSVGYVSEPTKSDIPNYDLWKIELGGQSQFHVVIYQKENLQNTPAQILYHQFAQIGIREDGLRLREDFQIEVLNEPVRKLEFEAASEFEVYSVTLGNDLALPFEIKKQKDKSLIIVDLIDPLMGISRPLSVRALASPSLEGEIIIPRLKLTQAHFLGGTVHVDISAPLETHEIKSADLRQTGVLIQEEQGEAYDFKQYSSDARLSYRLALPDLNLSAKVHSQIQVEDKEWKLKSRIHWSSAAGSTYRLESIIPAGWEITQVKSLAKNTSGDLVWDVEQSGKQQNLRIRLPTSVSPDSPYSIEIQAKRIILGSNRTIGLSCVKPLGCNNIDRFLELTKTSENQLFFESVKEVEERESSELPQNWKYPVASLGKSQYFHLSPYSGSRWGQVNRSELDQSLQVVANTYITLNNDVVQENFILNCVPSTRGMKRVLIYLSEDEEGEPVKWSLSSESGLQSKLSSQKLAISNHQRWHVPNLGELWELTFSTPIFNEVEIRGERSRPFLNSVRASLVYAPQAKPFRGMIRVLNSNELNLRIKSEGLVMNSDPMTKKTFQRKQRNYEWEYEQPLGALTIGRFSEMPDNSSEQGTATITVNTQFGHGDGEPDVHQATVMLDLSKSFDDKFTFHFPANVKLISTSVGERRITPIELTDQYLVPLFDQLDSYKITIQYQTLSSPNQLTVTRQIPFPQVNQHVLATEWNFILPSGIKLVSGPENMALQEALPEESLIRRFFGVLGQKQGETENSETKWHAAVFFPVKYGTLETSNTRQAKIISWIVLLATILIGLLLRIYRIGIRNKLCIILALISLIFSWILPFTLAQIAGSCFTGILIVMLIPRRFLWQESKIQVEDQSTKAYQQPVSSIYTTARLFFFIILSLTATVYAQSLPLAPNSPVKDQSTEQRTELVLIPKTPDSTSESIVYLRSELIRELENYVTESTQPEYLLNSAHYAGSMRDNQLLTIKAVFQVQVPAEKSFVMIQLPISGGNLGGPNSCMVDGKVSPVLLSTDGRSILIKVKNKKTQLPKIQQKKGEFVEAQKPVLPLTYQDHQIELVLHPAVRLSPTSGQFEIGIPRISKNQFDFQFKDAIRLIEITDENGMSIYELSGKKQFSTFLKESSRLNIKWMTNQDSDDNPLQLEAVVFTNTEVSPSLIHLEVKAKYNVINGKVDYLTWKLPPGMILRSVKSPEISIKSSLNTVQDSRSQELLLELSESKTGEFVVDAVFDFAVSSQEQKVSIPIIDFSFEKVKSKTSATKVLSHQIGVRSGPEFEIEQAGTLPDGVVSISSKSLGKQIESSILKSPALLFQVSQSVPISLILKSKKPERKARINQSVVVNRKNIDWNFSAELRVSQAPAFRHSIIVPEGLRIESLSIKEEDVERLAHWHRIGNKIILFLKNKTSGLQDLTLNGWLPVRKFGKLNVPNIQIEGAEIEDSQLTLFKKNQVDVKFISSHYQRIEDDSAKAVSSTDLDSFVGRFQAIESHHQPLSLLIKPRNFIVSADSLTIVQLLEASKIEVSQSLHFSMPPGENKKLSLIIPADYSSAFAIDGMPYEILDKMSDGRQRVELQPGNSETGDKTVTVRSTILKPVNEFNVIPIIMENSKTENHFLLLSSSLEYELTNQEKRNIVAPENIPDWIQARCNASPDLDCERLFISSQTPWKLNARLPNTGESNQEFIPFMESEILLGNDGAAIGSTYIKLFNQTNRELKLEWPRNTKLTAILMNDELDTSIEQKNGLLTVPLNGGPLFYEVTLFWKSQHIDHQYFLEKINLEVPKPSNIRLDKNLIKIITSAQNSIFLSNHVVPFSYVADKLEKHLEIAEIELELGEEASVSPSTWGAIQTEFNQLELILSNTSNKFQGIREKLNRFDTLKERVFVIKQYVEPAKETTPQEHSFVKQFQHKLATVPVDRVRYYASSGDSVPNQEALVVWNIPNLFLDMIIACLSLLILLPITSKCIQPRSAAWLNAHPTVGLLVLGLLWILFLSPQVIGIVIISISVFLALKTNRTIPPRSSQPITNFSGTQSLKE
ncbi:hypothetical protein [Gimesia aquarii]|uniref:Uncharacterized protein n=1 Tax=Gimesia aquarii TaxID=2527964 RepID=A0A517W1K9_9PLAN|nr:hypothetical protein [Gimesia aquarii]QDT99145.1 hypothetical protein V144x_46550 [Gimesia aquarii]